MTADADAGCFPGEGQVNDCDPPRSDDPVNVCMYGCMCDAVIITTIIIQQSWLIRVWPTDAVGSQTEMLASACRGRFSCCCLIWYARTVHDSLRASERARSMSEPAVETNGTGSVCAWS